MHASAQDGLAARLFDVVEALMRRSGTSALGVVEDSGITPGQMKGLLALAQRDVPVSVGELAEALSLTPPTASRTVDALTQRGFVDRQVSSEDRRARDLVVTPAGHELVRRVNEARTSDLQTVIDGLSAEQRERLSAALDELGSEMTQDERTAVHA